MNGSIGFVRCLSGFVTVLLLCRPLAAQTPPRPLPILQVTVEDEQGLVFVGAQVSLAAVAPQQVREGKTDGKGHVAFDRLAAGEYTLRAESPGFKKIERRLTIGANQPKPLTLQLQIDVSEVVNVEEKKRPEPVFVKTSENADAIKVDDDLLAGIPMAINALQITDFLSNFLSPVVGDTSIIMDGQEVGSMHLPPKAIESLQVNKNPYAAEYRRPGRGRIEVVSQNGSRTHYHGDALFSYDNSAMNTRSAFEQTKPNLQQHLEQLDFGGTLHQLWPASFFVSASLADDLTTGIVNALLPTGPFRTAVPEHQSDHYWRGRLDVNPIDRLGLTFKLDQAKQHEVNGGIGGLILPELGYDTAKVNRTLQSTVHTIFSARVVNDAVLTVTHATEALGNQPNGPAIVVNGAFTGGVDQHFERRNLTQAAVFDVGTAFRGAHTLRFGARFVPAGITMTDGTNFGGTYTFANLDAYNALKPTVYEVVEGEPTVRYRHQVGETFFQDEMRLRKDFSLMLGTRYDYESGLSDHNNVAPRIAFSFAPGAQKTNIRGGAGVFYERLGDEAVARTLLQNNVRTRSFRVTNPVYPDPFASGTLSTVETTGFRFSPDLKTPYLVQSSISLEHELWRKTMLIVEYSNVHGMTLYRVMDANAPAPGVTLSTGQRVGGALDQVESTGRLSSHAVYVTFSGRITGAFDGKAIYTYSNTYDNTPGAKAGGSLSYTLPANSFDLDAEWGPADFDVRHRFVMTGLLELPAGFQIGSLLSLRSGSPYSITTGFDDNGDGDVTDRPAGVTRNSGRGPGFARLDLRLMKIFKTVRPLKYPAAKPGQLHFSVDVFNVFNRGNYRNVVGVQSSPLFGIPVSVYPPQRKMQATMSWGF